jgi:SagB-type dehydrogenase family enzyme
MVGISMGMAGTSFGEDLVLPQPDTKGTVSVEEALQARRSHRRFTEKGVTKDELSQLLWAAYGVTRHTSGVDFKTAPSAGALYPLDVYAVVGEGGTAGIKAGVYRYLPEDHRLRPVRDGDQREDLGRAALQQMWLAKAPVVLVITGEYRRTTGKYGNRGQRYVLMESGNVSQNIFLQAEALGLKAGIVGAFHDREVSRVLGGPAEHEPLLIMPVGHIR